MRRDREITHGFRQIKCVNPSVSSPNIYSKYKIKKGKPAASIIAAIFFKISINNIILRVSFSKKKELVGVELTTSPMIHITPLKCKSLEIILSSWSSQIHKLETIKVLYYTILGQETRAVWILYEITKL